MTGLIIALHVIVCILLIIIILVQRGRGGGLVDTFSDVESMFGTKTPAVLTRVTTILSVLFFITCLSLALFAANRNKSLMSNTVPATEKQEAQKQPLDADKQGAFNQVAQEQEQDTSVK
ncbi:MAG: preprotein translocase subunit SecG [Candidatus Omnitrophota bacterium]|jgi:preprotein translocase subunit SecG|nr:MAG: preprotein translocase subunit SecG [Candidatus Omnitrophota bacterium]